MKFFAAFVGTNALVEAIAAFFIIGAIASALFKARLIDAVFLASKNLNEEISGKKDDREYILDGDVPCEAVISESDFSKDSDEE